MDDIVPILEIREKKLGFVIFGIVALVMISSMNIASAELSYEKQVKFVTTAEEINGHILAARENIKTGNQEFASLHLTHPIIELYDDLHTELKNDSRIDQKLEFSLYILKNTDPTVDVDSFDKQTNEIIKILDEVKNALISHEIQNDSVFQLDVISDLLDMSEMEYQLAMNSENESLKLVEFQDSLAFVIRAESILYKINDIELEQKNKLGLKLQQVQTSILNQQPLNDIKTQFVNIIDNIEITKESGLGFVQQDVIADVVFMDSLITTNESVLVETSVIPSWIKLNAAWWSDDVITDTEFLSSIEYMIEQKILVISVVTKSIDSVNNEIPSWIKNRTGWWADGLVSDKEFLSGIEYMIEREILTV